MALITNPISDAPAGAAMLRRKMGDLVGINQAIMAEMRALVTGRKAAIVTALGAADAAELATLYGKLKDFVDTATGGNEPGIPAA